MSDPRQKLSILGSSLQIVPLKSCRNAAGSDPGNLSLWGMGFGAEDTYILYDECAGSSLSAIQPGRHRPTISCKSEAAAITNASTCDEPDTLCSSECWRKIDMYELVTYHPLRKHEVYYGSSSLSNNVAYFSAL